jgi:hypothetical protein
MARNDDTTWFDDYAEEVDDVQVEEYDKRVKESDRLRSSVQAFLEVGNERNKLVHQDFATFSMEKTLDEIYGLYQNALVFVDFLPLALRESDALPVAQGDPSRESGQQV